MTKLTLKVNGKSRTVEVEDDAPLLYVLRDNLGLNGPKFGCGLGQCGSCTVIINGQVVRSCLTTAKTVQGQAITTRRALFSNAVVMFPTFCVNSCLATGIFRHAS